MNGNRWTEEELAILKKYYPDAPTAAIAKALQRPVSQIYGQAERLGLKKSEAYLASPYACRLRRGDEVGKESRFAKGHTPWNKGKPGSTGTHPNSRRTQFKKGEMTGAAQQNYVPIGTTRVTKYGMLERKVTDDLDIAPARRWVPVSRLVWEAAHGPIPPKHVVRFKPGMSTTVEEEITLDRLECISQAENMRRNTLHRYPKEIALAIQLRGALNRKINDVTKHKRPA